MKIKIKILPIFMAFSVLLRFNYLAKSVLSSRFAPYPLRSKIKFPAIGRVYYRGGQGLSNDQEGCWKVAPKWQPNLEKDMESEFLAIINNVFGHNECYKMDTLVCCLFTNTVISHPLLTFRQLEPACKVSS